MSTSSTGTQETAAPQNSQTTSDDFSAPLPSPTSTAPQHFYFPPPKSQQQTMSSEAKTGNAAVTSSSQSYASAGGDTSSPLRRDFGLLAEAAKRAQIAVLARDLGDVGL